MTLAKTGERQIDDLHNSEPVPKNCGVSYRRNGTTSSQLAEVDPVQKVRRRTKWYEIVPNCLEVKSGDVVVFAY
ncbi:hypothetical protein ABEW34_01895 [Paenibacillus algorifonticola]|uniref:hypothetical protein n=1 Tax=Paenibacillus algorifonticola TaxID=684063 RepID=UPI003D2A3B4D